MCAMYQSKFSEMLLTVASTKSHPLILGWSIHSVMGLLIVEDDALFD